MIDVLVRDYPEQFKGKPNIEALAESFDTALCEVFTVFEQLRDNRVLSTAKGVQLDRIGDIVCLSRSEAAFRSGKKTIEDSEYRKRLIQRILQNTSDCTYYDVMDSIKLLWNGPPLRYSEDPRFPASFKFDFDDDGTVADDAYRIPVLKPSGVGVGFSMHKKAELTVGIGFAVIRSEKQEISCEEPTIVPMTFYTDGVDILTDELGNWLAE